MITEISMKNFKSWEDTGGIRLAPLTGFFGTNSSGKTSLLQMPLLLKQTVESPDRSLVFRTSGANSLIDLGTVPEMIFAGRDHLELSITWKPPEPVIIPLTQSEEPLKLSEVRFTTNVTASKTSHHVERLSYEGKDFQAILSRKTAESYNISVKVQGKIPPRIQSRPVKYMTPIKSYGFSPEVMRYFQDTEYLDNLVLAFEQLFQRMYYLGPLREYPKRVYDWSGERPADVGTKGEKAVAALLSKGADRPYNRSGKQKYTVETRIAQWLKDMGMVESFRTVAIREGGTQYELRIKRTSDSAEVLITDMGFGVSQLLPILVLCYYAPEGSVVILEQPEIHLHPSAQSWLADIFIDVVKKRKLQIVVESHSEHFLRRLQRRIAEEEFPDKDAALYFCEIKSGASIINALDLDEFGNIRNWPKDFFGDLTGDLLEMAQKGFERQLKQR